MHIGAISCHKNICYYSLSHFTCSHSVFFVFHKRSAWATSFLAHLITFLLISIPWWIDAQIFIDVRTTIYYIYQIKIAQKAVGERLGYLNNRIWRCFWNQVKLLLPSQTMPIGVVDTTLSPNVGPVVTLKCNVMFMSKPV